MLELAGKALLSVLPRTAGMIKCGRILDRMFVLYPGLDPITLATWNVSKGNPWRSMDRARRRIASIKPFDSQIQEEGEAAMVEAMGVMFRGESTVKAFPYVMFPCERPDGFPPFGVVLSFGSQRRGFLHLFAQTGDIKTVFHGLGRALQEILVTHVEQICLVLHVIQEEAFAYRLQAKILDVLGQDAKPLNVMVWRTVDRQLDSGVFYNDGISMASYTRPNMIRDTRLSADEFRNRLEAFACPTKLEELAIWVESSPRNRVGLGKSTDGSGATSSDESGPLAGLSVSSSVGASTGASVEVSGVVSGPSGEDAPTHPVAKAKEEMALALASGSPQRVMDARARLAALERQAQRTPEGLP